MADTPLAEVRVFPGGRASVREWLGDCLATFADLQAAVDAGDAGEAAEALASLIHDLGRVERAILPHVKDDEHA